MSSSITTNKVPPFMLYIISLTLTLTFTYGFSKYFDSIFGATNSPAQTAILANASAILTLISILIGLEFVVLRSSINAFNFIVALILEATRLYTIAFFYPSADVDATLFLSLSMASFFGLFVSKFFRSTVNTVANKPLTKNLTQVIPAVAIILIFAGSTLLTTFGFAPISQEQNPQYIKDIANLDFSTFKTPSWNAQYFLDNILDQFQAGMNNPFKTVFNVTNNSPDPLRFTNGNEKISSYLKDKTYFNYEYDSVKAKSSTFLPADTGVTTQNLYLSGKKFQDQTFSKPVPDSLLDHSQAPSSREYNAYNLTVSYPINHTSLYDDSLPVPWSSRTYGSNGQFFGSFINPNSTQVFSKDGSTLLYSCPPSGGLSSCAFTENQVNIQNFPGISDVGLRLDGFPTSGTNEILNYSMNYLEPNYNYLGSYSGTKALYPSVFGASTWDAIKQTYLQMPSDVNGTAPAGNTTYQDWAPLVFNARDTYLSPSASVMTNIYSLLNAMRPAINSNYLGVNQPGGAMNLTFDADFWLNGTYINQRAGVTYPAPGQDYVNWFLTVKNGISSNFAAAATMILRSAGIPARFVTGYALGNTTDQASTNPYVTVYQRIHKMAWAEALVPLNTPGGLTFEWVIVDPIGGTLASLLGLNLQNLLGGSGSSSQSSDFIAAFDPYLLDQSDDLTTIPGRTNFEQSIYRVGVDQKNSTGQFDYVRDATETGYLGSNGFNPDPLTGNVTVGVFVEQVHAENGTIKSFFPYGGIPVTFQAGYFNNNTGQFIAKAWNDTAVKAVVLSDPVTGYAAITFQYKPYYNNLTTPLHGTGPINFIAIPGNTHSVNSASCNYGLPLNCTIGISDQSRTNDGFSIDNYSKPNIKYDPMQLVIGPPPVAPLQSLMSLTSLQNAPPIIYAQTLTQNTFNQKVIAESKSNNFSAINSNVANVLAVVLVVGLLQYVVEEKRK